MDPEIRIDRITTGRHLSGLGMPSLSLLLYWKNPERFVPYNSRTIAFLSDFKLLGKGMSASSSRCYVRWLRRATDLAQKLRLPTPGHIDRMVELYYEDHYENARSRGET